MADIFNDIKREIYSALVSTAAPTKSQAPAKSNAGGQGRHGEQGKGSATGRGHSTHGQGLGLGHGAPAPVPTNSTRPSSGVGGPRTIQQAPAILPITEDESATIIVTKQISDRYPNVDPNLIQSLVAEIQTFGFTSDSDNDGRILAVDFDGTIAEDAVYPEIGSPKPGAVGILLKLQDEGWKVVIFSHRASLPGGKEQIATWLKREGLPVSAIIPKVFARWYIDNKAVEFNNNWADIYSKMHYDVPVEMAGPTVVMAPAILAGKYSMQEIVAHLGYNYKEFKADIKRAYGDFSQLKQAGITQLSIQNMFRAKYGLDISPAAIAASDDDETYWRTKLAYAIAKLETNRIEVGDDVMVMTDDRNFGKVGTIMNLTDTEAEVLEDGIANLPLAVTQPLVHLRLLSGPEKKASMRIGEDKSLKLQSSYYPTGLQPAAITSWYNAVGYEAYKRLAGLEPVTYHRTLGSALTCEHRNYTGVFADDVNVSNLTAIAARIPDYTKTVAVKITPTAGASDSTARYVVSAIMDDLAVSQGVEDIQVRFAGSTGYYLLATFTAADHRENHQERVRRAVAAYMESNPRHNYTLGETLEPDRISIVTNIRVVPAAYSVDMTTGLVCMPLDPMKLEGFNPSQATITHLSEIYELGIAA